MLLDEGAQTTAYGSFGTAGDDSHDAKRRFKLLPRLLLLPLVVSFVVFAIPLAGTRYLRAGQSAQQPELYTRETVINASGLYVTTVSDDSVVFSFKLSCADYDDDQWYPTKPGMDSNNPDANCEVQDGSQARCRQCLENQVLKSYFPAPRLDPFSAQACQSMCGDATALCANGEGDYEYIQPCMWQVVANLPAACAHQFENVPPFTSNNLPPRQELADVIEPHNTQAWGCETHAMCQACADPSQPTTLAPQCLSVVYHYYKLGFDPGSFHSRIFGLREDKYRR